MTKPGEPWITHLETSLEGMDNWNLETSGMPGVALFGAALQVWLGAQNREGITVDEAALAFNVRPEIIRQAVETHYWMFLSGDVIEQDGE